ncbi:hypothetical protein WICPIJ_008716 [Wickerhamomyces pijperi]|uniref:Uncharacterized protein n=1 Tax=Wickerhamomyces pijperi TaxID=599730 RepID=A0A9P8PVC8_WICPI|nr:hypothetical protein WICPIJ_008716 [Wickerhamomyces pijperi]
MNSISEIPTLHPTEEQFQDPITYLSNAENMELAKKYGAVKIVPPAEFKPPLSINKNKFKFVPRMQKLKELNLMNRCRLMFVKQLENYNEMKKIKKPKEIFEIVDGVKIYYYDFFIETLKYHDDEISHISSSRLMGDGNFWSKLQTEVFKVSSVDALKGFYYDKLISYFNYLATKPDFLSIREKYPSSLLNTSDSEDTDTDTEDHENDQSQDQEAARGDYHCLICHKDENGRDTLLCDSCDKPYHRYCLSPPLSQIPKHNWYCDNCIIGNGYYGFTDSSHQYSLGDFKDMCNDFDKDFFSKNADAGSKPTDINQLESIFWNLVNDTNNTVKVNYGADIRNNKEGEISGFPTIGYKPREIGKAEYKKYVEHPMNLNNLPFNEKSLLNYLNVDISGMTIPWIYVGSTFSTFCWHVEDQYTLSANYQHFGAVKKWYLIPESSRWRFELYLRRLAPDLFKKQPDILHQLITLVPPADLIRNGIEVYTANQSAGEYIVTYPRVYHAGFNTGFNFNEAVNFTMDAWLDYGVQATKDYKMEHSQKASVFDIYEMMINILKEFESSGTGSVPLIEKCLKYLQEQVNQDSIMKKVILDNKRITKPIETYSKPSKLDFLHKSHTEKFDDDGISCMKCNGFCTFNYVKHYSVPSKSNDQPKKNKKKDYLPTPYASPSQTTTATATATATGAGAGANTETEGGRHSKRLKTIQDMSSFELQILCLEDYSNLASTVSKSGDFALRDEMYSIVDLESVDKLIESTKSLLEEQKKKKKMEEGASVGTVV